VPLYLIAIVFIINEFPNKNQTRGDAFSITISAIMILLATYLVVVPIINTPTVIINNEFIKFNNKLYYWHDIESIALTGSCPMKISITLTEGICLMWKDGAINYVYDRMYSNTAEIKLFIEREVLGKENVLVDPIRYENVNEEFQYFKRNPVFSSQGITLLIFTMLFVFIGLTFKQTPAIFLPIILWPLLFTITSSSFDYFGLSDHHLQIKNYSLFWTNKIYAIKDIKEIVFESGNRLPKGLRIITNDYKTKLFKGDTLTNKQWADFKEALLNKQISVRSEVRSIF
jgi:hypothetical protein